jgi:hypothetical protein
MPANRVPLKSHRFISISLVVVERAGAASPYHREEGPIPPAGQ